MNAAGVSSSSAGSPSLSAAIAAAHRAHKDAAAAIAAGIERARDRRYHRHLELAGRHELERETPEAAA